MLNDSDPQDNQPVIEGQLKEKKGGKWKLFKKWKSRYFTLSGAKLTYKEVKDTHKEMIACDLLTIPYRQSGGGDGGDGEGFRGGITQTLDVGSIRSVKVRRDDLFPRSRYPNNGSFLFFR